MFKRVLCKIANILAVFFDMLQPEKREMIKAKRNFIAKLNKRDFVYEIAKVSLEAELAKTDDDIPDLFYYYLCNKHVRNAEKIFNEKKAKGYFDELNILIK